MKGITRQCQSKAEKAETTITNTKPPKANIKVPPGLITSKGAPGAPVAKYPNTKATPLSVAEVNANTPLDSISKKSVITVHFNSKKAKAN